MLETSFSVTGVLKWLLLSIVMIVGCTIISAQSNHDIEISMFLGQSKNNKCTGELIDSGFKTSYGADLRFLYGIGSHWLFSYGAGIHRIHGSFECISAISAINREGIDVFANAALGIGYRFGQSSTFRLEPMVYFSLSDKVRLFQPNTGAVIDLENNLGDNIIAGLRGNLSVQLTSHLAIRGSATILSRSPNPYSFDLGFAYQIAGNVF